MLSISAGVDDEALQMFHSQDALFAENAGQWDTDDVYFGYNKGGTQIYFTDDGLDFGLSRTVEDGTSESPATTLELLEAEPEIESTLFSLSFDNATPTVPVGADQAETVFNYHLGAQENWVDGVSTYKTVLYRDLYDGIDLHTFSLHGQMKYEFHVNPGADYTRIELSYSGIEGLSIGLDGSLHIATELGEIVDEDLYIYQTINGQQVEVAGQFTLLDADTYTFTLTGDYDPTVELVIDPNLDWGSYLGGSNDDYANGVSTDPAGNVYVCGYTASSGWGISGGMDVSFGGWYDGFLVKLDENGNHLWSSYLGGSGSDSAYGVSTDPAGDVYVCGDTQSSDWEMSGGWDTSSVGPGDGYVIKFNGTTGSHLWSSYIGGSYVDLAYGVSTDTAGDVYVCGETWSNDWNISGGWDTSYGGGIYGCDGYVVKLCGTSGSHLWSTYLGGGGQDYAYGVSTDAAGNVYVCGSGGSGWSISGGWDISFNGSSEGFIVKLSGKSGSHLWSSYLGGSDNDCANGVSTDAAGNVYVCGYTASSGWGISGGMDVSFGGWYDGFLVKLDENGNHLWSSYLGGSGSDFAFGVSTDPAGDVYVCGSSKSSGWVSGGWDSSLESTDGFLVKLNANGEHLWSTYLGRGSISDERGDVARGVNTDSIGNVYVAGFANSSGWISGGWDISYGGGTDGFLVKINDDTSTPEALFESNVTVAASDATFSVTYSGIMAISTSSIGTDDIQVTGPGGYSQYAAFLSIDDNTDGTPRTATYRVTSPGAEWTKDDNGMYQITMVANQVSDTAGNFVTAGLIGTFEVAIPNQLPTADAGGPYEGTESDTITLDASGSTDTDGTVVSYEWDLDADGQYDDASGVTVNFNVPNAGTFIVAVKVTDDDGASDTASANVMVQPSFTLGDANGDGRVDGSDVTILAGNWQYGVTGVSNATWSMGDFNADGRVDGSDVTILAGNWQAGVSITPFSGILFVDADAMSSGDGLNWETAYDDLQSALAQATVFNGDTTPTNDVDQIWIAEGTYTPNSELEPGDTRSASFSLLDGVTLYGGFHGTETTLAERDLLAARVTTLSGDLGVVDDTSDNAYTVVYCGEDIEAAIDGLSVIGGNANISGDSSWPKKMGGGIFNYGTLTVTNSTLSENLSSGEGGGIFNFGNLTITNSTLSDNSSSYVGGGIGNLSGTMTISNSTFSDNSAGFGAGIYNDGGGSLITLTITNSLFTNNSADHHGGGIYNCHSSNLAVRDSIFSGNSTGGGGDYCGGAGIFNSHSTATIISTSLLDNSANGGNNYSGGGGIYNQAGTMTVTNSTLSGNSASGGYGYFGGGGIYNYEAILTVTNSTISGNSTSSGGGVYFYGSSSASTLNNTIVADNTASTGRDILLSSGTLSGSHNLIGDMTGQTLINGVDSNQVGTASSPIDPMLSNLTQFDNCQWGYYLLPNSPAIDAGDNTLAVDASGQPLPEDVAGNTRIQNGTVDIGAYEFEFTSLTPGDANSDGRVDGSDVTILAGNWQHGVTGTPDATWSMGDFNADGKVDGSDVTILAGNWQAGVTSAVVAVSGAEEEPAPIQNPMATSQFDPPTNAEFGVATVPRRQTLPPRRLITPTGKSTTVATDAVLAKSTWCESDYAAVAKDLVAVSVKKITSAKDKLFALDFGPYAGLE